MTPLELRIWPGPGVAATETSSSPVARMATRGRRKTSTVAWPQAAARAMCCGPIRVPAGSTSSPARASAPWATMFSPGSRVRGGSRRTVPGESLLRSTCSIMATASAPRGYGRAGHDLPGGVGRQRTRRRLAGVNRSGDLQGQVRVGLRGPAGESVAGGTRERRLIAIGVKRKQQERGPRPGQGLRAPTRDGGLVQRRERQQSRRLPRSWAGQSS